MGANIAFTQLTRLTVEKRWFRHHSKHVNNFFALLFGSVLCRSELPTRSDRGKEER